MKRSTQTASESARSAFEARRERLLQDFHAARERGLTPRLHKRTSNLFRIRPPADRAARLDVTDFRHVIAIDPERRVAEVEGMTTYEDLVEAALPYGLMPAVVPQLKTITVGGAVTGGGIESSSFRYGFVHETVEALEILDGRGETVHAQPDNEHRALFYGFANSYGTLGYALRVWIQLIPIRPYVQVIHTHHSDPDEYFNNMAETCRAARHHERPTAFIDGAVFDETNLYQTEGSFVDEAERVSRYTFMDIYYRSIRRKEQDTLATRDYLWRWDTDWFWCSRAYGMEIPALRFLAGSLGLLNSATYWKLRDWNERGRILERLGLLRDVEWVIQDVEIPVTHAPTFLAFLHREIGIRPIWICPAQAARTNTVYPLYRTDPDTLYINFGFWGGKKTDQPDGYHNRLIEERVAELEGKKSLYSTSFFTEEDFWARYNRPAHDALKTQYDPENTFPDLYTKCVGSPG